MEFLRNAEFIEYLLGLLSLEIGLHLLTAHVEGGIFLTINERLELNVPKVLSNQLVE
jgi:hypothetical protein